LNNNTSELHVLPVLSGVPQGSVDGGHSVVIMYVQSLCCIAGDKNVELA